MKKLILAASILVLSACDSDEGSSSSVAGDILSGDGISKGVFTATIKLKEGDKIYNVPVSCVGFNNGDLDLDFMFASDDMMGMRDTDGDGIILRGDRMQDFSPMAMMNKSSKPNPLMVINLTDNGKELASRAVIMPNQKGDVWEATSTGIKGEALMQEKETVMGGYPMTYEVKCQ